MRGLMSSRVQIIRQQETFLPSGVPIYRWFPISFTRTDLSTGLPALWCRCRLDVTFRRALLDPLPVIEAGRAADRLAVAWFMPVDGICLKPGDRINCMVGPITGQFSIDQVPDQIGDYLSLHHIEMAVKEVSQMITVGSPVTES
jgi:hypothetical protein